MTKEAISDWFRSLQHTICNRLEIKDGTGLFKSDKWERADGGGGDTRVMESGTIIEKGGVAFSAVFGATPPKVLDELKLEQADFFATGVSIVIHPINPFMPIIHMNVRYFEMSNGVKWFGGGIDLTPHYIDKEDASYFHKALKVICDKHNANYYPQFKKWADDYFFIKHRNETRGIGGVFFDRLTENTDFSIEDRFKFVQDVGESFVPIYSYFMKKNSSAPFNAREKEWQMIRRSRYVEFNLVYDSGTKFGLETNGRVESILMSMPPQANWFYNVERKIGIKEKNTLLFLKKDINWIEESNG